MPVIKAGGKTITDFCDLIRIVETKDLTYTIRFTNAYTGNNYVIRIFKELFDKTFESRIIEDLVITKTDEEEVEMKRKESVNSYTS